VAIAEHRVEEYKNLTQDYWRSSKPNSTTIYRRKKAILCIPYKYNQCCSR